MMLEDPQISPRNPFIHAGKMVAKRYPCRIPSGTRSETLTGLYVAGRSNRVAT